MKATPKILLIEDNPSLAVSLRQVLTEEGYEVALETRGDDGLARAQRDIFDAVLTDLRLPGLDGLNLVRELHAAKTRLPIILMTAHGTTETAIEATQFGAFDYVLKPFEMPELLDLMGKAVASSRLMTEAVKLGEISETGDAIIGNSRPMQAIFKEIGRIADKPVTVLIRGETGTGKEIIARAIYQHSLRTAAPFIAINCAAIPETLLESELFGHEKGAFTGADARRIGRFEQAHQGTIFLDEIGDLSPGTQVKFLRVLQEKCLQRLGGRDTIPVDVRVIAATHCNLEKAIQEDKFRQDLFYRLSVVVIHLPPLRERKEDIPALVNYFTRKYGMELGAENAVIQPGAMEVFLAQSWPGNVRELENVVRNVLLLGRGYTITPEHVLTAIARPPSAAPDDHQSMAEQVAALLGAAQRGELSNVHTCMLERVERELFCQAIKLAHGNQSQAARWLGVSRLTMRDKLSQFAVPEK